MYLQNPLPGDGGIVVESSISNEPAIIFRDPFTDDLYTCVDVSSSTIAETQLHGNGLSTIQAFGSHYHSDHFSVYQPGDYELRWFDDFDPADPISQTSVGVAPTPVWYAVSNPGQQATVSFSFTLSGNQDRFLRIASVGLSSSLIDVEGDTYMGYLSIKDHSTGTILYEDTSFGQSDTAETYTFVTSYTLPDNLFLSYGSSLVSGAETNISYSEGIFQESATFSLDWSFSISTS